LFLILIIQDFGMKTKIEKEEKEIVADYKDARKSFIIF
jgi:hypothetical protein